MKILYLETKRKLTDYDINSISQELALLPKQLFLAYSIQYKSLAEQIKTLLEKQKTKIVGFQQVLGCSKLKSPQAILLIGSGRFHALNLALQNKEVYIYNNSKITKISEKDIQELKNNKQAALTRFLHSTQIGILISTKPGQSNLPEAKKIKGKIEKKYPQKQVNLFLSNNINLSEFENFPIDLWINTACPGLINDSSKIINIDDISEFI